MDALTIPVQVGADRRLVIDLPSSTPTGPADVVILPRGHTTSPNDGQGREAIRARLLAAGFLVTDLHAPDDSEPLDEDELTRLGTLAEGARSTEELLAEERGRY